MHGLGVHGTWLYPTEDGRLVTTVHAGWPLLSALHLQMGMSLIPPFRSLPPLPMQLYN